ncbi:MAG TPA: hypothetical protein VHV79_03945 [Mycobacteriales bacterium]|jgi:hypothetical protein|nr:hypothetical protein [Mycobacteriales bacterium]
MTSRSSDQRVALIGAAALSVLCLAATTGITLAAAAPAHAHKKAAVHHTAAATGSGLGGVSVSASSSALSMPLYQTSAGEDVQADIPYSLATLGTGGIGDALTSVLWPGATGAHGGDALDLLGIKEIPASDAQKLNDPELAEAQTGVGNPTVTNSHPGLTMSSTATTTHVQAVSSAGGAGVPVLGPIVGSTTANSDITIKGPRTLNVTAVSSVHGISIDKVISIKTVTSTAQATTNGRTASGTAVTTVSGMTIAGVPVQIDNQGLHIPASVGPSGSLPISTIPIPILGTTVGGSVAPTLAATVNNALKSAGIHIELTKVTQQVHGAHVTLNSGALEVSFGNSDYKNELNNTGTVMIIGGAKLDAQATPGFAAPKINKLPPAPKSGSGPTSGSVGTSGTAGTPGTPGTPAVPGTAETTGGGSSPQTASAPSLTGDQLPLPNTLSWGWVVAGLAGAGLFAFAMRRLPDKILQSAGPACRLEE